MVREVSDVERVDLGAKDRPLPFMYPSKALTVCTDDGTRVRGAALTRVASESDFSVSFNCFR